MKRNIAHLLTVFLTSCVLVCNVCRVNGFDNMVWHLINICSNIFVIFFLLKSLSEKPKKVDDTIGIFVVSVLSTNLSIFVSLFGHIGKISNISFVSNVGTIIMSISMFWYLYSLFSLGKGLTILPEAHELKIKHAYMFSRHPLYLTYIIWAIAQNMIFQSVSVFVFSIVQIILLLVRAKREEKVLLENYKEYKEYMKEVHWIGRKSMKKFKGSFTLEAAVVMSSIIMILFAILYAFMIMYQNVVVTYAASYAAQQGATTWVNSGLNIDDGTGNYNSEVYYRIAEFGGGGKASLKKTKIENCVREKLKAGILSSKDSTINVEFKNYVLQRQVHVEIKQNIPIPFSGIVKFFNGGQGFVISTKAVAAVPEPTEYIRNCDYAIETATVLINYLNEKLHISDGFEKIKSAIGALN